MPPVTPCHDRHGGARFIWAPCVFPPSGERSPRGAPSWRFLAPRPCSPLFGIPSGFVRRPHSPHRVIWPGGPGPGASAGSVAAATASTGQPRPGSPYGIASRKLPSWARLERYINDLHREVKRALRYVSILDMPLNCGYAVSDGRPQDRSPHEPNDTEGSRLSLRSSRLRARRHNATTASQVAASFTATRGAPVALRRLLCSFRS